MIELTDEVWEELLAKAKAARGMGFHARQLCRFVELLGEGARRPDLAEAGDNISLVWRTRTFVFRVHFHFNGDFWGVIDSSASVDNSDDLEAFSQALKFWLVQDRG
jgi:hypothetical protein